MVRTQVEPRAAGEWFHCQVLDILWRHFMVYSTFKKSNLKQANRHAVRIVTDQR